MKEKVLIGIVGTGFAKTVQIPAFQKCEGAEVVSVSSAHLENAERAARDFNIEHFTADWRETAGNKAVDLVCITTPPVFHKEMTLFALEHGKHVLCEKPMAMNAAEAREMLEKSQEKNVLTMIDHELRFLSGRRKAKEMIQSGEIGRIRHAKYNFRAPHRGDPKATWNWWSDIESGGGALGAIGSHVVDSLLWFSGAEISQIFCQLQTHVKQRREEKSGATRAVTSDDQANIILRFADGDLTEDATGSVSMSMVEMPDYQNSIEFSGTKGSIKIEYKGEVFTAKKGESEWRQIENVPLGTAIKGVGDTGFSRGFMKFAPEIIRAIQEGRTEIKHAATFADGLKVQKVLDAARESDRKGCSIKIERDE